VALDPTFLLGRAEPDEHDRGRGRTDHVDGLVLASHRASDAVLVDRDAFTGNHDLQPREGAPPRGRAFGDIGRAADEGHGLGALGGQAQQHRGDLHSRPSPDRAAAP
jgi:hypothetical protein